MIGIASSVSAPVEAWPALPLHEWHETYDTLHMWTQIVGKIRLSLSPPINHWWHAALYITARGLSTGPMPCGDRTLEILFDLREHDLTIECSDGQRKSLPLIPRSVADFHHELMASLHSMEIEPHIWPKPVEFDDVIPFDQDHKHASYDAEYATRLWQILLQTQQVFTEFRGRFLGKCSPVHFFWGSFDLAVTRFNGKLAPAREGANATEREAYSHECISHGFWPGGMWFGKEIAEPIYYSYTVPAPAGLAEARLRPAAAAFNAELGEFVLNYNEVRRSRAPRQMLMDFLQSTYEAGANLAHWDRAALERR